MNTGILDKLAIDVVDVAKKSESVPLAQYLVFLVTRVKETTCIPLAVKLDEYFCGYLNGGDIQSLVDGVDEVYSILFEQSSEYKEALNKVREEFNMSVKNSRTTDGFVRKMVGRAGRQLVAVIPNGERSELCKQFVIDVTGFVEDVDKFGIREQAASAYAVYSGFLSICEYYIEQAKKRDVTVDEVATSLFYAICQCGYGKKFYEKYKQVCVEEDDYEQHLDDQEIWNAFDSLSASWIVTKKDVQFVGLTSACLSVMNNK